MENRNKRKQFILSIICIMLLVLFSIGMVYAFFTYAEQGSYNNIIRTADMNITFKFEDNDWIWLENAFPMSTQQALTLETANTTNSSNKIDGGLAQFTIKGSNKKGLVYYNISLVRETPTETITSKSNYFSFTPTTEDIQYPDGAISINLQTSTSDIFQTSGLVNDLYQMLYLGNSITQSYQGTNYINYTGAATLSNLPTVENENERIIANGAVSSDPITRYFELRMWVNDTVLIDDDLREACLSSTTQNQVDTNGYGYCDSSTPNLPSGINYVYSQGEYDRLYLSNKIRIDTTTTLSISDDVPSITRTLLLANTPVVDNKVNFGTISGESESRFMMMNSTANDHYPIYYFRGNVQNNHLIFGGFCWRIVRTTETGGTKLIYDGEPDNGVCNNTGTATQIGNSEFNGAYESPALVGYKGGRTTPKSIYTPSSVIGKYYSYVVYGKDITYQNGNYTLTDTVINSNYTDGYVDTSQSGLRYHHYTCFTNSSSCSKVYYIHYLASSNAIYFILTDGKDITTLMDNSLQNTDETVNSTAYNKLVEWYTRNLISHASQLEDTGFCNDRSIYNLGGFSVTESNINNHLYFKAYYRLQSTKNPSLSCSINYNYTVSESKGNGQLEYPIGLLTADEYAFAGAKWSSSNYSMYLYNGQNQWTLTPYYYYVKQAHMISFSRAGYLEKTLTTDDNGLRPVVSLSKDVIITGGNGTSDNPYIVGS